MYVVGLYIFDVAVSLWYEFNVLKRGDELKIEYSKLFEAEEAKIKKSLEHGNSSLIGEHTETREETAKVEAVESKKPP